MSAPKETITIDDLLKSRELWSQYESDIIEQTDKYHISGQLIWGYDQCDLEAIKTDLAIWEQLLLHLNVIYPLVHPEMYPHMVDNHMRLLKELHHLLEPTYTCQLYGSVLTCIQKSLDATGNIIREVFSSSDIDQVERPSFHILQHLTCGPKYNFCVAQEAYLEKHRLQQLGYCYQVETITIEGYDANSKPLIHVIKYIKSLAEFKFSQADLGLFKSVNFIRFGILCVGSGHFSDLWSLFINNQNYSHHFHTVSFTQTIENSRLISYFDDQLDKHNSQIDMSNDISASYDFRDLYQLL